MKREDIRIEVLSDPRLLKTVRDTIRTYVDTCGLPLDRCDEVVLAVDEACANSMRHSYSYRRNGKILVSLSHDPNKGYIEIVLRDDGAPIPPEATRRREIPEPDPERLKSGGLGIPLICEVFDEVKFLPGAKQGNCVIMRLKCPCDASQGHKAEKERPWDCK